jgi:O-antigen/teichoic acid export membrane protein
VFLSVLRGRESYARFAWLNAGSAALGIATGITALAAGGDLTAYMTALLAALVPSTLLTGYASRVRFHKASLRIARLAELARAALPFLGWNLALRVYGEVDKILLALLATDAVIGWYAAAYRIVFLPGFIATLVMTPLLPVLSRHANDRNAFRQLLRQSVDLVLLTTVPLTALIIGLAPAIPSTLHWSASFANSIPLLVILAFHVPLAAIDVTLGTALVALHREGRWFGVAVLAVLFNVSLNLVLIPLAQSATGNGAIGAAVVTLLTELLMLGGALVLLPGWAVPRASTVTAAKVIVIAAAAGGVAWVLYPVSFVLAAAAAFTIYAVLALTLGAVSVSDFRDLGLGSILQRTRGFVAVAGRHEP